MMRKYLLSCFASAVVAFALPHLAQGHALWTDPKPRDNRDGWKEATRGFTQPCGVDRRATQMVTAYKTGGMVMVKWAETVTHPGCFLLDLSTDDKTFVPLATVKHKSTPPAIPTVANPRLYEAMITLPAGVACPSCTLRIRQIMLGSENAQCPPAMLSGPTVYYSCANIVVNESGTLPQGDGGVGDASPSLDASVDAGNRGGMGGSSSAGGNPGSGGASSSGGSGGATGSGGTGGSSSIGGAGGTRPPMGQGGAPAGGGTVGTDEPPKKTGESGGCSQGGAVAPSLLMLVLAGVPLVCRRRSRRR